MKALEITTRPRLALDVPGRELLHRFSVIDIFDRCCPQIGPVVILAEVLQKQFSVAQTQPTIRPRDLRFTIPHPDISECRIERQILTGGAPIRMKRATAAAPVPGE